ncbi:MAG: alkaline phosphatase family protein [Thermodesulfobacteriota bacterium]|jgi:predicted AlkP superfamily phosphohydrolase/phosphomutase
MGKVVMIGLDGAPFGVIQRLTEEGILPNIKKLIEEGAFGPLLSSYLPETPIAWTSIMTGKNAGKHGVFDWGERAEGSYDIGVSLSHSCKEPPLWQIIGEEGKEAGIFNLPLTYPPKPLNGFLVSGFDTPSTKVCFTYPDSLSDDIRSRVKDYVLAEQEVYTRGFERRYVDGLLYSLEKKEAAALYLIDRYDVDFSLYVFMEIDHLHHKLWRLFEEGSEEGKRLFQEVYQRMDETVGKIINRFDEETTFILVSDHGAGPLEGIMFINKWLMEEGWLRLKRKPSLYLKSLLSRTDVFVKGYRLLCKFGLGKLGKLLPASLQYDLATSFISFGDVDWKQTKAYAFGTYGQIFVNLKGREPQGIVAPGEEYEHLLKEISQRLLELVHPKTGRKMVQEVLRKEELYQGPMLKKAPDLSFVIKDYCYDSSVQFGLGVKGILGMPAFEDSGTHRREGILIVSGKGIKRCFDIKGATLVDIAPTALYLLDLPIPINMDGKVLSTMFKEDWMRSHPIGCKEKESKNLSSETKTELSHEEMEMVKKRLRGLGYLD